jgi:hypothetical protein
MSVPGVRRDKAALSSGCKPHPATAPAGSNRRAMEVPKWLEPSEGVSRIGDSASVQAERRASLEKNDAQADLTAKSGKADTTGLPSETIRPVAAPG